MKINYQMVLDLFKAHKVHLYEEQTLALKGRMSQEEPAEKVKAKVKTKAKPKPKKVKTKAEPKKVKKADPTKL
ncbi:MAG: hypothetical protein HOI21_02725 [Bacteroidetes Order II. Incertae sedis bacterium]|jgi:hypothetical protein|nr:hypothetical protein [Bacteroidetes Order II. bacterium]